MPKPASPYRGRFAPSPSGPLHAGSLVAALGSYLDARANDGLWLVRIEDIDPPREVAGADQQILAQLEAHGLLWDQNVRWQSKQSALYESNLQLLAEHQLVYACDCTRKAIKARAPFYTGYCRNRKLPWSGNALRLKNDGPVTSFADRAHGQVEIETEFAAEDFTLRRRDGLWAYQLAVVSDDRDQGITHIVRGSDLLTPSSWQMALWQSLNRLSAQGSLPSLLHLPLVTGADGLKLSKQNHAPAIESANAPKNINEAIISLGFDLPQELLMAPVAEQLAWATSAWRERFAI